MGYVARHRIHRVGVKDSRSARDRIDRRSGAAAICGHRVDDGGDTLVAGRRDRMCARNRICVTRARVSLVHTDALVRLV